MTILSEPGRVAKPAKPSTPAKPWRHWLEGQADFERLQARQAAEAAAPQPAATHDQALREAFGELLGDDTLAALAAAGRYDRPAPAVATAEAGPEDAYDQYARVRNLPPEFAARMRKGRYL